MAELSNPLALFFYDGPSVTLSAAPFKSQIRTLYRLNTAGTGWQTFNPSSTFNAVTTLEAGRFYFLDAASVPFDLPGATLTLVQAPAGGQASLLVQGSSPTIGKFILAVAVTANADGQLPIVSIIARQPEGTAPVANVMQALVLRQYIDPAQRLQVTFDILATYPGGQELGQELTLIYNNEA